MQKLIPGPVDGFKIFNDDLTCLDFQFSVTQINVLPNNDPLVLCNNGFHFCKHLPGVWSYYRRGRVFKIRAYDVLDLPETPGVDYKLVCRKIEIVKEIMFGSSGHYNSGHCNSGDYNSGDRNSGDRNSGDYNSGHCNSGDYNSGDYNSGDRNSGQRNSGDYNSGDYNSGDYNSGRYNLGDYHAGYFCIGEAPLYLFNKKCNIPRTELPYNLMSQLYVNFSKDDVFDVTPFLKIPNATKTAIERLHKLHIERRKNKQ